MYINDNTMKNMNKFILIFLVMVVSTSLIAQNNRLDFDGVDDYVTCGIMNLSNKSFAIEGWFKADDLPGSGDYAFIFGNIIEGVNAAHIRINGTSNKLEFIMGSPSSWTTLTSNAVIQTGIWYHVAILNYHNVGGYDYQYIVLNGIVDAYYPYSTFYNYSNSTFRIGGSGNTAYLDGLVDEVKVWTNINRGLQDVRDDMYKEVVGNETGLLAYYKLDETGGTTANDSQTSSNYDGTLTNMTGNEWTTSSAFFGPKNCLDFDGSNYVLCGNDASLTQFNDFTMEAWVKLDNSAADQKILGKFDNWDPNGNYYMIGVGNGKQYSQINANGNKIDFTAGDVPSNKWTHLAVTFSKGNGGANGTCYGYVNGEIVYSKTDVADAAINVSNATYQFRIGAAPWDYNYFRVNGLVDEVRIWSSQRSTSEIRENMYKNLIGDESNLVAYYNLDKPSGASVPCFPDKNNDGTNYGATSWVASTAFNTWLDTDDSDWSTASNWSRGSVPSSTDNVGIYDYIGGSNQSISSAASCNNLSIGSSATLTISSNSITASDNIYNFGTLAITGTLINNSSLSKFINNGTLTVNGTATLEDLTNNSGKTVTINEEKQMTVEGDLDNDGTITISSSASGTGSLIVNGTATGDVKMERYIEAATWNNWEDGWHFVSSPVANYDIATSNFVVATAAEYDFYAWSEKYNVWVNYKDGTNPVFSDADVNGSDNFEIGRGYMAAYKNTEIKDFTGNINIEDVVINGLTNTGGTQDYHSWHLLGNPFNSALTWDDTWTTENIGANIQIWNEAGSSYTIIANDPGGVIPATNGFMIQGTSTTSASVTIPKSKRVHNATPFYKNADFPIIKLKANNIDNPSFQESQLLFNPESSMEYNPDFDCDFLPGYAPLFYSNIDGRPMGLNSMPDVEETTTIPFTFIKNEGFNFSIEMYKVQNMDMDVWLYDNKLNKDHNLTQSPVYYFTAFENDNNERFAIHFSSLGIDDDVQTTAPTIRTYASNNTLYILNPQQKQGTVTIYNLTGQKVAAFKLTGDTKQQQTLNLADIINIVKIQTNDEVISSKVIFRN